MFDGGSCVDVLRDMGEDLTAGQRAFLDDEDPEDWKRPAFTLRDACGKPIEGEGEAVKPPSVYTRPIDSFAVSQCPSFRRLDTSHAEEAASAVGIIR